MKESETLLLRQTIPCYENVVTPPNRVLQWEYADVELDNFDMHSWYEEKDDAS